ncbi:MAG: DNA polymerase III subunit delta [Pseudanabaenaceae cyanobacterium]
MPSYFWWGEDDYQLQQAIDNLRRQVVDPHWQEFNLLEYSGGTEAEVIAGLATAMTPAFGAGGRLTWLSHTPIGQKCSEATLKELERTLPNLPKDSHLLFTATSKPDGRLAIAKLLQQYGEIKEFNPIPPWKTEAIVSAVSKRSAVMGVALSPLAVNYLAEAIGNDLRRLDMELKKLRLAYPPPSPPLSIDHVKELVVASASTSVQLAHALRNGECDRALEILGELLRNNEAGLRICATLVGQFRTWVLVKLGLSAGERDDHIAKLAELGNPKRVYFLKTEVQNHSLSQWLDTLPILLELESSLKRGGDELTAFTTAIYQICQLWSSEG